MENPWSVPSGEPQKNNRFNDVARSQAIAAQFIEYYNEALSPEILEETGKYFGLTVPEFGRALAMFIVSMIFSQGSHSILTSDVFNRYFWFYMFSPMPDYPQEDKNDNT